MFEGKGKGVGQPAAPSDAPCGFRGDGGGGGGRQGRPPIGFPSLPSPGVGVRVGLGGGSSRKALTVAGYCNNQLMLKLYKKVRPRMCLVEEGGMRRPHLISKHTL